MWDIACIDRGLINSKSYVLDQPQQLALWTEDASQRFAPHICKTLIWWWSQKCRQKVKAIRDWLGQRKIVEPRRKLFIINISRVYFARFLQSSFPFKRIHPSMARTQYDTTRSRARNGPAGHASRFWIRRCLAVNIVGNADFFFAV